VAPSRRSAVLLGPGVACGALLVGLVGIAGRDLAGDEQNMLHGTPAQIFQWSLDPRGGFVGHLPLSFWARWVALSLFSEVPAWAWRLHAVAFTAIAAAITAATAHRHIGLVAGILAGALLLFDPIVVFHSHEASNYAASVLTGALMLRGLLDLSANDRNGAWWLGAGLLMGAANDFYSVLLAAPALAASAWLARRPGLRRPIGVAWLIPALVVAPFVLLFISRLFESTGSAVLDVHADPLPPRPFPAVVDAPWRVARRLFGAHLHGYAGGRNDAPWIGLPPVLMGILALGATLRGRAWPAALLALGALLTHGLLGIGLQLSAERILPFEPRSLIGLTPALAVAMGSLATRRTAVIPALWLAGAALSTLEASLDTAHLRDQALAHAAHIAPPGAILVVPDDRTRTRAPTAVPCAPAGSATVVAILNHEATTLADCTGTPTGLPLTHRASFDAPVHEGSAASFLPRRVVAVFGAPVSATPLRIENTLLDGLTNTTWTLTDPHGATLARGTAPSTFPTPEGLAHIAAFPTAPAWLPDHPLFLAHRNQVQAWERDPLDQRPVLRAAPLQAPWLTTLRRLLPVVGVLLTVLAFRRRP